jgi:ABC-type nitrate/sulfonate/bicarbonate transport system substrate-binding protein
VGTNHSSAYFDMVCNPSADAANGSADEKLHALVGKKIALSGIGSPPYIQLAAALKNHNMSINDVTVVNVQVGAPEYAAMEAGQVDCMIGNPNDAAYLVPAGGRYLALNFGDQGVVPDVVAQASGSWVSMSDWADAHPKEVAAFAGAWAEAVLWMQDPNNFDGAQQAIQQAIGKGAATGPALETETHAVLGTLTPVWGTATAQAGYNADLTDGVLTDPIQNFNPSDFVAASAPADAAAAQKLAAATP